MAYQKEDAWRQFNRWSRYYDCDPLQPLLFRPSHHMLIETMGRDVQRILDIGCGTGQFAALVAKELPQVLVFGLDLSSGMLHRARARHFANADDLPLVQADSERLPFADDSFDAVTCSHSFHHYPQQEQVLREIHRVLRPGGRAMIIDGDRDGLWGRLVFDGIVVLMEGQVHHLSARDARGLYGRVGFADIAQRRRGGPLPFLMTTGIAAKAGSIVHRAA
jgi:ubiquinone/menaquinone biosynthesis C-methylase UbiE